MTFTGSWGGKVEGVSRTALLIGVGDNPGAEQCLRPLGTTVEADLRAMTAALRGSGYTVEALRDPTRNEITERITAVSNSAAADSTLLLYFTGHGVRIGDTDYLVPADGQTPASGGGTPGGWEQPHIRESLLDADISKYLAGCGADTVLWLIDACRSVEDARAAAFGSHITKGPPNAGFAVMTGCAPGERSGFTETGSFFSLALAQALGPLTEAGTVEQVYQATGRQTKHLARRARAEPQQVQIRYGSDREARTRSRTIARSRPLLEAWQDAVRTTALWKHVPDGDTEAVAHLQDGLAALAIDVARQVHHAQERLPDPWADDEFPVRLLRERLPVLLSAKTELSALEVTALIAGVLLHEAAWADRLSQAAELMPYLVRRSSDADDQRRHYEQIAEHHPQISEKLTGWYWWDTDPSDDRNAVMLWLVHRWIGERFATDEEAVPAVLADSFVAGLLGASRPAAGETLTGRAAQLSAALRTVSAGLVLGAPSDDQRTALPGRHVVPAVRKAPQRLRVRPLAALLRLAGLLALDARRLPEVLAEHLAVSDPVVPCEVITVLRDALWDPDQEGGAPSYLHLDAVCPHPAIHAALASVVEDADELGYSLRETAVRLPADEAVLLRGVPARLTDHRLRPEEQQGLDAYDVPLARFSLAQTEIRQLLMGEKLYDGNPALALRELYQNAMDACRYRDMRVRYLRGCGKEPRAWTGRIRIETGEDSHGRYVECVDNGVGMTVDQLKSTFTRAGRRFDQSRSFRREQAAWLRHDRSLRLYPNSRFGIGVFSYFMLADEMTIVTRPVGPDGRPAVKALRVEIPVSGSLFRVREDEERDGAVLPDGGTRVRLYLRDSHALKGGACLTSLRSLVLISEFELEVRGEDGREQNWPPACLRSGDGPNRIVTRSAVEALPGTLWWVEGDGAIVCDGIVADRKTFGYVLNLTGEHAGELSVNRNKLEGYDRRWAHQRIRLGAQALSAWPGLTLDWLRTMESRHPAIARILWREWQGQGVQVLADHGRTVNLDEVGWFRLDSGLDDRSGRSEERWLRTAVRPWRSAVLGHSYRAQQEAAPRSLEGHPIPRPGWSDIAARVRGDWRNAVVVAHKQGVTVADVLRATRGLRIAHLRLAGPAVHSGGDLNWKPDFTDRKIMTGLLGAEHVHLSSPSGRVRGHSEQGSSAEIHYQHPPQDLSGIVRASAKFGNSLGELATVCAKYAPFLSESLAAVPDHHRDHVCTDDELRLLYLQEDAITWSPATSPWDIRAVAGATHRSPRDVLRRVAEFGWLRPVPDQELVDRWAAAPDDLFPVLRRYVVVGSDGLPVLPWAATLDLSAEWEISVRKAERILAKAAKALGLVHRRRYAEGAAGRGVFLSPETGSLAGWLHGQGIRLEDGVALRDLAYVRPHDMSHEELSWYADELREADVELPDAASLLEAWDGLPTPSRYAFSGTDPSWDGADYPVPATSAVLFTASQQLRQKLSFLWKTAHREAQHLKLGPELVAPELPKELKKFRPTWDETVALVDLGPDDDSDGEWFESPRWKPLTPQRLVTYACERHQGARTAYRALAPLRAIGALVPELSAEAVAALPDDVPGAHDALAVDPAHRVSAPGSPLVPLDLVSIAGRLGESMRDTWRRITPYLGLEETAPSVTVVLDAVPHWQDLAILSEGFDGRLPALAGPVSRERVVLAARAVEETPEWVRDRMELYAEMFGLRLAPVTGKEEGA
ncbi:caspase family protein [Streptomyces sp. NBC_01471]|uniref:HD domain-containing protein n=1 Tax=Streptomyces sp. NBC_01471 TaxID=2903879 RepID=UPI00324428BF